MVTIPQQAMAVVEILRRDVPKPTESLFMDEFTVNGQDCMRFYPSSRCPMGLHPNAIPTCPVTSIGFCQSHEVTDGEVKSFYQWWDSLTLEQATQAVDLIWTEEQK